MRSEGGQASMFRTKIGVESVALRCAAVAASLCFALLLLASQAHAAYEQLPPPDGVFGGSPTAIAKGAKFPEEVQLGGVGAMAINRTGAGGVPKGTIYAAKQLSSSTSQVAMYEPNATGRLEFAARWPLTQSDSYERCGPALGVEAGKAEHPCSPSAIGSGAPGVGIGVNQSTGDVYVFSETLRTESSADNKGIVVYKADGSEVVSRFGELAPGDDTVAASPSKIHQPTGSGALAVNQAGEVVLFDQHLFGEAYRRLMVFKPHEGDVTEYEYAGEIAGAEGNVNGHPPATPVFDDNGNLYVAGLEQQGGTGFIEALAPETPGPFKTLALAPRCSSKVKGSGIYSMTVDPTTGEPFYFTEKRGSRIGRFGPCDEATHAFAESAAPEEIPLDPKTEYISALTFDPAAKASPSRPLGALYAGRPIPETNGPESIEGTSAIGYVLGHPQLLNPEVKAESVSHVTASGAVASAVIEPNGFNASYVFHYLTAAEYETWKAQAEGEGKNAEEAEDAAFEGASEAPLGGGVIKGSGGAQTVAAALGPLLPGTAYRFRVVTQTQCKGEGESPCEASGESFAFNTFPLGTLTLPDGRAWELVSPADKQGGQVLPVSNEFAKDLPSYVFFAMQSAEDGNTVAYEGTPFSTAGGVVENEYVARRDPATGWHTVGLTPSIMVRGSHSYDGFDRSLNGSVFVDRLGRIDALDAVAGYANLYTQSTTNPLALTPLLTNGLPFNRSAAELIVKYAQVSADGSRIFFAVNDALTPEAEDGGAGKFNLYEWHAGQLSLVNVMPGGETEAGASFATASANTVSEDGLRAFFSDAAGQVYVREGGITSQIPDSGKFLAAAKDGSRALLDDGFLYDLEAAKSTDLTEGQGGFLGEMGQSDDLTHVYFVDSKVLPAAEPVCREGDFAEVCESAANGANNLYAWEEGGQARFVAQLAALDSSEVGFPAQLDWVKIPAMRSAEASPSGRYLAFMSQRPLTGYDNTGPCANDNAGGFLPGPCPEAYLFDAATGRLVCASCNPTGARPLGWARLTVISEGKSYLQPRYLADSGRLVFGTKDSLSPLDTNEGFEDVYQWEPAGVGGCASESAEGGCVSLISSGHEANTSRLVATDETGRNVFFVTRDRLVPGDKDELVDLYDAREGGGFAAETETHRGECQGESCQPPVAAPNDPTPGSSSFDGPGNVKESSKKAKHQKKKNHKKKHHKKKHHRQGKQNRRAHR